MNINAKEQMVICEGSRPAGAEQRLKALASSSRRHLSRLAPMWKLCRRGICFF